ncbi:MAG TPA: DUF748 domain-containing protein [Candidatus Polarisedimenticolaceae bacterium]|nr:DUF748 domain-containing protein [Candidatus Polarisedimenticolaceae bacterium]
MPLWKKLVLGAAALVAAFALLGFFVAPPLVKARLLREMSKRLNREVSVGKVSVNPFELSMVIHDLKILDKDGKPFASWDRAEFNYRFTSLLSHDYVFDALTFEAPYARFVINEDGSLNIDDLLRIFRATPSTEQAGPPSAWRFETVRVTGARIGFTDRQRSPVFETTVGPFELHLDRFSTKTNSEAPYGFEGKTESGESFSWHGQITSNPLRSSGELTLSGIKLPKYRPYYETGRPFRVLEGTIALKAAYNAVWTDTEHVLRVHGADLSLTDALIGRPEVAEPDITVKSLTIEGADADLLTHAAKIDAITLDGGHILIENDPAHGGVNLHQMIRPYLETPVAPTPGPPGPPVPFSLGTLTVKNVTVDAADLTPARPFKVQGHDVALTVKGLDNKPGTLCPTTLSAKFGDAGTVDVTGTFASDFHHGDLDVEVKDVAIAPTDSYIDPVARVRLASGTVGAKGHVAFDRPDVGDMHFAYKGDLRVYDVAVTGAENGQPLFKMAGLKIAPAEVHLNPTSAKIGEISVRGPRLAVGILPDKTIDLMKVLVTADETAPGKAVATEAPKPLPPVTIDTLRLDDGSIRIDDRSLEPNVAMTLTKVAGTVKGISTQELARANVDIAALWDGVAPVKMQGQINPIARKDFTDLKMTVGGVDLVAFSPYSGKYVGYGIGKGKMAADLSYKIAERKFTSENVFTIDQFELGPKVESPDAMHLPMKLAVAVLRDKNGQIVLDVPAEGSVDDPEFRYGKVIMRAVVNVLTKVVTSPFRLLAGAFGGGKTENIEFQVFEPGSADLADSEKQKLGIVAKSMAERPELSVSIDGDADPAADAGALAKARVASLVRMAKWKATGGASADDVTVAADEYPRWLQAAYDAAVPPPSAPPAVPATVDEMESKLAATKPVTADDLRALAAERGKAVRDYLVETGQVDATRLFLSDETKPDRPPASRVWLDLK